MTEKNFPFMIAVFCFGKQNLLSEITFKYSDGFEKNVVWNLQKLIICLLSGEN